MNNGSIHTHIQNNIATITFYHPDSNSFSSELLNKLTATFNKLSANKEVYVIVLKSEKDKTFCAGASFKELISIANFKDGKQFFLGFANVINAMRKCSKLIIGRVQGKVVGGGVGLAAACDYCFATEQASIKLSELTIGIAPFVIAPAVRRKIGLAAFSELAINATNWQSAYWAKEKGLYANVFKTTKELDAEVKNLSNKLSNYNLEALIELKKILWGKTENWNKLLEERAEISGKLVLSEFTENALQKFKK